jgi:hypothetical protein
MVGWPGRCWMFEGLVMVVDVDQGHEDLELNRHHTSGGPCVPTSLSAHT